MLALELARLLLLATFVIAGLSKVTSPLRTRRSLAQFGLPRALVGPVATTLPLAELMVALGLAMRPTAHLAAAGALVLLSAFTATVSVSLLRGRRPECACFGSIRPTPIGARTIVRNVVLGAVSTVVLLFPATREYAHPGHAASWLLPADIAVALVLLLLITGWLISRRLRTGATPGTRPGIRTTLRHLTRPTSPSPRQAGLPIGAQAPRFDLPALDGSTVSLDSLRAGARSALLIFASPACEPCTALMPTVVSLLDGAEPHLSVAVIVSGDRQSSRHLIGNWPIPNVACDEKAHAARLFRIRGTPTAVLVGSDGTVASDTAAGTRAVVRLLTQMAPPSAPGRTG